jgi:hypothetical protein
VPPLIGGSLSQQVSSFRSLIRREYDLVSFNYSGHGSSSDQFSLGATIRDTFYMLTRTYSLCKKEQLPLFGIASCYSAIPILYAVHHLAEPLKGLVLINAIPNLPGPYKCHSKPKSAGRDEIFFGILPEGVPDKKKPA